MRTVEHSTVLTDCNLLRQDKLRDVVRRGCVYKFGDGGRGGRGGGGGG